MDELIWDPVSLDEAVRAGLALATCSRDFVELAGLKLRELETQCCALSHRLERAQARARGKKNKEVEA